MRRFGQVAQLAEVTTATDLVSDMSDETVATYEAMASDDAFPLRLVPAMAARLFGVDAGIARLEAPRGRSTDRLWFGLVKLVVDGSI